MEKNNTDEQNRIFAEMESLNPKHENVFQAKAKFLEEDDNWDGAYATYKECVAAVPTSVQCLRRITNIRSSTMDDKIKYGLECLEVSKNDPLCLVDVAIAYRIRGELSKAKEYFERALNLPPKGEGYNRDYILFQYGHTLKSLNMNQEARKAFSEACRLNMKSACDELKNG
jgi:tetratricopeptide (TPR) repeat protein